MTGGKETELLLSLWREGERGAGDQLLRRFYDELRSLAASQLGRSWSRQTLQATELVHEAWFRLCGTDEPSFENRRHFFGCAASAMRQALIDRSRRAQAERRGGDLERVQFDELLDLPSRPDVDLLELDNALRQLERLDAEQLRIVEMRYFLGLTIEETAGALALHPSAVNRKWESARAWLLKTLSP
ncbi:MAG: sigma-70 family RNA polymerase sigma factor [Ahniella sp.]|nr:sigma-70 family RNA polymerase sigma factor [Ahniella sp.]